MRDGKLVEVVNLFALPLATFVAYDDGDYFFAAFLGVLVIVNLILLLKK